MRTGISARSAAALVSIGLLVLSPTARAVILTGEVLAGSSFAKGGRFVELTETDGLSIGADTFDDHNLYAFNERQNVFSDEVIEVDIGRNIAAEELVASHYVAYDPVRANIKARVIFDAPIIGIATSTANLAASDFLMNSSVNYLNPSARGLEGRDWIRIDPDNAAALVLMLHATSPGDFIRVFTERSRVAEVRGIAENTAIPVPPAIAALGTGLLAFGLLKGRARH